jgi:hypothetical protein
LPSAFSVLPSATSFASPRTFPEASLMLPSTCLAEPAIRSWSILPRRSVCWCPFRPVTRPVAGRMGDGQAATTTARRIHLTDGSGDTRNSPRLREARKAQEQPEWLTSLPPRYSSGRLPFCIHEFAMATAPPSESTYISWPMWAVCALVASCG